MSAVDKDVPSRLACGSHSSPTREEAANIYALRLPRSTTFRNVPLPGLLFLPSRRARVWANE